jgi:PGF-CTERM protein
VKEMRKEGERMKKYGLIGLMLLVMLATPAMAQTLNKGPISNTTLAITSMKLSDTNYTYGTDVELTVTWGYYKAEDYGTRYIAIFDWSTYTTKVKVSGVFSVANASDPSNYKWFIALPEDGGSATHKINTAERGMFAAYYVVVVFNSTGAYDDRLVFVVEPIAGKPYVSISVTPMTAALGDRVELKYKMTGSEPYFVGVLVTGWEGRVYFANCTVGTWTPWPWISIPPRTSFDEDWCGIKYFNLTSAFGFTEDTEGIIVFKIAAGKDPANLFTGADPTRAEATAVVILAKPTLSSISVPSKHVNGTDITITGVTNVAETNSKYDVGLPNFVYLNITDLNDVRVCTFPALSPTEQTVTGWTNATRGLVGKDRTFSIKIDNFGTRAPCVLETGYYKAKFKLVTDTGFEDEEVTVFELVNGMVKIMPDKTTVVRGDTVKFTIVTNLKVNSEVYFTIKDARIIGGSGEITETLRVDATGKAYKEIEVAQTAPLTEYKFEARIAGDVIDTISISVVKQTLHLNVDKTTVARGGELRFTGTTTAEDVYVFASETDVFDGVAEIPSDTIIPTAGLTTKRFVPDTNDKLDFKLEVLTGADAGTYYLYFYAPVDSSQIDRASDPQKMFAIVVTDPRIVSVDIPSRIPYQGEVEVKIVTDPGKRERAHVTWVLEGSNIKVRPSAVGGPSDNRYTIDSNNEVSFRLNLKNYYEEKGRSIDPGLYVFTVKLYLDNEETDRVQKLIEISTISLEVTIEPAVIVVGDQIKVTVQTSREGVAGYDHIYVTMVGANYKAVQKVTLDSTGKGSVTFETLGLADGTYRFYIRDTMGTEDANYTGLYVAENLYDLDPADSTAKIAYADDDILVIRTIQILKERPTPTPTTPPPTTPPVTTPPATTPTPTPTTPKPTTPAPTTTPAGGIPGFEAIFAIAGLLAVAYLLRRRQ